VQNSDYTYVRKVTLKNAEGETEEHVLCSNSILDLDAQYIDLQRKSEVPKPPTLES
jgi:hypothetical protein